MVKEAVEELAERLRAVLWVQDGKDNRDDKREEGGRMNEPLRIVEISDYL